MRMKLLNRLAGAALLVALGSGSAAAQGAGNPASGWQFALTPYVWFSGIGGEVSLPRVDRDFAADFGDILSNLEFAAMATAEIRRGRFGLLGDVMYLSIEQDVSTPRGVLFSGGEGRFETTAAGAVALYRIVEDPRGVLDIGGGLRAWWLDARLSLSPGLAAGRSSSGSTNWVDPVIAARGRLRLGDRLGLSGYVDIGGFGAGSDLTWQVAGTLDWQVASSVALHVGWRHLEIERDRGAVSVDVSMSGPIVAATIRF